MTTSDQAALEHYESLIAARYPPALAVALAAARYAYGLQAEAAPLPLPALRAVVMAARDAQPPLRREAGRMLARIEQEMGIA